MIPADPQLLRTLGRHAPAPKLEFVRKATDTLARFRPMPEASKKVRRLSERDYDVLEDIRRNAEKLYQSLARARPIESHLREAWKGVARGQLAPEFENIPEFERVLWQLAQSCLWLLADKKARPAHRPAETHSPVATLVSLLADDYYQTFGSVPTTGSGSPFVKFCQHFLPENDLDCPSLGSLATIVRNHFPHASAK